MNAHLVPYPDNGHYGSLTLYRTWSVRGPPVPAPFSLSPFFAE
jgi:hypothetical protein